MSPRAHIQWSRHVHKAGATLLTTVLAAAMILLPHSLPTHAQGQTTTIDSGTVNLFKLRANAEGASWTTLEHTSTSGETTEHNHKDVLIRVPATTHTDQLPQGLPITSGYTVHPDGDLTLGWDVSAIQSAKYDSAFVKLETSGPTGARVVVHSMDDNGTVTPVLKNGATELEGVTRFDITQMNRVNTVWTFSHPGTYTIDFRLGAERIGASLFTSSASGTITFHVGEGEPSTTASCLSAPPRTVLPLTKAGPPAIQATAPAAPMKKTKVTRTRTPVLAPGDRAAQTVARTTPPTTSPATRRP